MWVALIQYKVKVKVCYFMHKQQSKQYSFALISGK